MLIHITTLTMLLVLVLGGCATSFTGSPHVDGGRGGCETKCTDQGLVMTGLVYLGEYSTACVCEVPGAKDSAAPAAAVAGGAAGVVMQMRRQQEQQQYVHQAH